MTILVDFGDPKGTFGDPKKGHDPQFEKRWVRSLIDAQGLKIPWTRILPIVEVFFLKLLARGL
jgi:hypothetical protein